MKTELVKVDAYATATLEERRTYASSIAQAGDLLPRSLWAPSRNADGTMGPLAPSPAKVLLLAETGSMLGLHPMAALQGIHIIEGKPTLSANLLAALVRRAGHKLRVTTSGSWADGTFVARAVLVRADDPDFEFVVEWGRDRAQRAGLLGKKGPWSSYPEAMAKARAITEVIREGAPDATIVAAYTPEELGASNVSEDGEVVEATHEPEPAPRLAPKPASDPVPVEEPVDAEVVQEPEFDLAEWGDRIQQCVDAEDPARRVDMLRLLHAEAKDAGLLRHPVADGMTLDQLLRKVKAELEADQK